VSLVSGENMQASFTTMLPNINGIIELCGLLFAPSYQIRHIDDLTVREQRRRKADGFSELTNVGALFGCGGYKQKTSKQTSNESFVTYKIRTVFNTICLRYLSCLTTMWKDRLQLRSTMLILK